MSVLLNTAGYEEDHPLSSLLDLVGDLLSRSEQKYYAPAQAEPKKVPGKL